MWAINGLRKTWTFHSVLKPESHLALGKSLNLSENVLSPEKWGLPSYGKDLLRSGLCAL